MIISEDEEKYIGRIEFQNSTNYNLIPTGVYAQLQIRYLDNGTDKIEENPILFQSKQISFTNQKYVYEVEVPKKAFNVYERTDKENVVIRIEGIFTKNERVVLQLSRWYSGNLIGK